MPLREGSSDKVIQDNIRCLLDKDGCGYDPPYKDPARKEYTPAQAPAIAYSKAGKRKNKAETLKGEKQTQSKQKPSEEEKSDNAEHQEGQMARDKAIKGATTEAGEDSDPCWDTHEMVGMKKGKGGKPVPNCVPKSSDNAEESYSEISVPTGWSVSSNVYRD